MEVDNGSFSLVLLFAALGLRCCTQGFSSCGMRASDTVASLVEEPGLKGMWASVVVACRLSCSMACGLFLEQGLNLCPLNWQVDSYLSRQAAAPPPPLGGLWPQGCPPAPFPRLWPPPPRTQEAPLQLFQL